MVLLMTPNMKERLITDFNENGEAHDLNLLKNFFAKFTLLEVDSHEIDIGELVKRSRKEKRNDNDALTHLWKEEVVTDNKNVRRRSSSTEGKNERTSFSKYWRKPSFRIRRRSKEEEHSESSDSSPANGVSADNMSLQQQLAMTALNLTAPACSTVLRNQRNNWVQLSGHPGSLAPAGPGTIWKKQPGDVNESWVYEALMKDYARDIVPFFYREVTYEGERFIELSDLLYNFNNPAVMDIKIGNRTFLESEVTNAKARHDLYEKMVKVDPNAPTPEEHEAEAITKLRYMDFRDNMSSSRSLSFRIEALKMASSSSVTELKKIRSREEVADVLSNFVQRKDYVKKQILNRLRVIRNAFEDSEFFKHHEVIGSSILIVYDDSHASAWIIDFGKTSNVPEGLSVNHRREWKQGNHEEGYLTGLDNIIKCFEEVPVSKRKMKFFGRS